MTINNTNHAEMLSQIIQLYDFSLSIGYASTLEENCRAFFDRVLAKRNLSYAALWLRQPVNEPGSDFRLMYSDPASEYTGPDRVFFNAPILNEIQNRQIFCITRDQFIAHDWLSDDYLPHGDSFIFIDLPCIGFVVFAGHGERALWQPWQLNQMLPIMKNFAASIMSSAHFEQLQVEIAERRLAEQRAREASQIKGEFLANMSHELRTPLNAVLGMSQLLRETELSSEQSELVNTILNSGNSLLELINSILDFTKLEANKVTLEQISFDLHQTVDIIYQTFRKECARKNLFYRVDMADDLPRQLIGDPLRLKQILLNLVANAVKFTRRGGVTLDISMQQREGDSASIRFCVIDTGIGIEPHHLQDLFKSFHQVDSSISRKFGGTGLGLAICKQLTELMQGSIEVTSEFHSGTTFTCVLPFRVALEDTAKTGAVVTASNPLQTHRAQVLLVEDDRINRMVASKLLDKLGCDIDVAVSGTEALQRLCEKDYELVFMDMQMPEMDGLEATRRIRQRESGVINPGVTILAMTANVTDADRTMCLEAGMDDFITKPIDKNLLAEKLNAWL